MSELFASLNICKLGSWLVVSDLGSVDVCRAEAGADKQGWKKTAAGQGKHDAVYLGELDLT